MPKFMKTGKTLQELASEVERQNASKRDYVAPTQATEIVPADQPAFEALPVDIDPESCVRVLHTVLPIANQHGLSVYDAMYLELALRLGLPLATLDQRLVAAGKAAGIEVL